MKTDRLRERGTGRRSAAKPLTKDKAWRIAANVAKLKENRREDASFPAESR